MKNEMTNEEILLDLLLELRKEFALYSKSRNYQPEGLPSSALVHKLFDEKVQRTYLQAEALRKMIDKDGQMFEPLPTPIC